MTDAPWAVSIPPDDVRRKQRAAVLCLAAGLLLLPVGAAVVAWLLSFEDPPVGRKLFLALILAPFLLLWSAWRQWRLMTSATGPDRTVMDAVACVQCREEGWIRRRTEYSYWAALWPENAPPRSRPLAVPVEEHDPVAIGDGPVVVHGRVRPGRWVVLASATVVVWPTGRVRQGLPLATEPLHRPRAGPAG